MDLFLQRKVLNVIVLGLLTFTRPVLAQSPCPSEERAQLLLDRHEERVDYGTPLIEALLEGTNPWAAPIQTLFKFDLEDETKAQSERAILKKELQSRSWWPTRLESLKNCSPQWSDSFQGRLRLVLAKTRAFEQKKLQFLNLPPEKRSQLYNPEYERLLANNLNDEFSLKVLRFVFHRSEARQNELRLLELIDEEEQIQPSLISLIQTTARDHYQYSDYRVRLLYTYEFQRQYFEQQQQTVNQAKDLLEQEDQAELRDHFYQKLNPLWRRIVDSSLKSLGPARFLPELPLRSVGTLPEELSPEAKLFLTDHQIPQQLEQNQELFDQIAQERSEYARELQQTHTQQLIEVGQLRSEFFKRLDQGHHDHWTISFMDLKREALIIPYRWSSLFFHRLQDLQDKLSQGLAGFNLLLKDILGLTLFLFVPFAFWKIITLVMRGLNQLRETLVLQSYQQTWAKNAALWLQRLHPFVPWVMAYWGIALMERLLTHTVLSELAGLLPYFRFFVLYKIFRRLLVIVLTQMTTVGRFQLSREHRLKINRTAKQLGLFALCFALFLHTIESVVSQGLIYQWTIEFLKLGSLLIGFLLAYHWRQENAQLVQQYFREPLNHHVTRLLESRFSLLLSLPILLINLSVMVFQTLKAWGSEFDISKRLSARVFRKKLEGLDEGADEETKKIPEEYAALYFENESDEKFLIEKFKTNFFDQVKQEIDEWFSEKSDEHSLALVASSGMGKSSVFRLLERHYKDLKIIRTQIPPKLTSKGKVLRHFGQLLDVDLEKGEALLIERDKNLEPTLILVDEAHHMFLSHVGGFEGFKAFLELINAQTKNIFWCAGLNNYSWHYLNRVFGRYHYFRAVCTIPAWSEEDIKNLILARHRRTNYQLSYDSILEAARSVDDGLSHDYIETKFFRLLWQQSGGNPQTATELWFSALRKSNRPRTLRVGLPTLGVSKVFSTLQDEAFFVYAEILRHENLTSYEVQQVTNLPAASIHYALKIGLENHFLTRNKQGRYQITCLMQEALIQVLKKKNIIYGN